MPIRQKDEVDLLSKEAEGQEAYRRAIENRNRILGFQRDSSKASRTYDDDEDWYQLQDDTWLSDE